MLQQNIYVKHNLRKLQFTQIEVIKSDGNRIPGPPSMRMQVSSSLATALSLSFTDSPRNIVLPYGTASKLPSEFCRHLAE